MKLRPVVPDELPKKVRKSENLVVEVDAMPGAFVCSASMKARRGVADARDVAAGKRAVHTLYTKEQCAFFVDNAPESHSTTCRSWVRLPVSS